MHEKQVQKHYGSGNVDRIARRQLMDAAAQWVDNRRAACKLTR